MSTVSVQTALKKQKKFPLKQLSWALGFRVSFVAHRNSVSTDSSLFRTKRRARSLGVCFVYSYQKSGVVNKKPTLRLLLGAAQAEPWQGAEGCDWLKTKKGRRSPTRLALEAPCYLTAF